MKFLKHKKGDMSGQKMIVYSIHAFIFAMVFFGFVYLIGFHSSEKTKIPPGIEDEILTKRFTDVCFSYDDKIGVIDFDKFKEGNLNSCYKDVVSQSYRLTLTVKGLDKLEPIKTKKWKGAANRFYTEKVLVHKDDKIYDGEMKIEVQK